MDDKNIGETINIGKTVSNREEDNLQYKLNLNEMQQEMSYFLSLLMTDSSKFDTEKTFNCLHQYVSKYNRILYSAISHHVYDLEETAEKRGSSKDPFGTLLSNVEILLNYAENINSDDHGKVEELKETKKAIWKIWDHVNLAQRQYAELKQSDAEYDEKFEQRIEKFKAKLASDMNSQLLTIVGIFTALAFIMFGGISSAESVLSGLKDARLLRLINISFIWGLGLLNVTFVFLFCVGKMKKLNIKSSSQPGATFWQKYPIVCWTNFIMGSFSLLALWFYYCINRNAITWLDQLVQAFPEASSIIGTLIIFIIVGCGFHWLKSKTLTTYDDEDK